MRTTKEYVDKLLSMRPNVYMGGQLVPRDDPRFQAGINTIAMTYDIARDQQYEGLFTVTSHLTGDRINRFNHIHQSTDDLLKKQEMTRVYCQKTGRCIQRCMGIDALNAISVVAKELDEEYKTEYYPRFLAYLQHFQKNDLVGNCAQTDVKGDRSRRPHQQVDADMYLRVVEKRRDGIIVRGAKAHNTVAPYTDEIIAVPTRALTPEEGDWAVAFAIPADAEGLYLITASHPPRPRRELKAPIADYGASHSITVFDNVFVPWERVFMCGEAKDAGRLAQLFATYHRHSYTGCKPAMTDVMMGATALVAEYNGVGDVSHIRDKIADMIAVAELVYAAGIAASVKATKASSGTFVPDITYANVGRYHAGVNIYHEYEILADVAGGLAATLPPEEDFFNPTTKPFLDKYIVRKADVPADYVHRCYRLIENLICSAPGAAAQISGIHGGGSPIMEKIAIRGQCDLEEKKNIAKYLAGIPIS